MRIRRTAWLIGVATTCVALPLCLRAQQAPTSQPATQTEAQAKAEATKQATAEALKKIRDEGLNRSQVMQTLSYLTDVIGGRLTGSPQMKRANDWTRDKLAEWGCEDAHLEAWGPFGRGWSLKSFSAQVVEPQCIPLIAYPKAWSPGTEGPVTGEVVLFDARESKDLEKYKGKLKNAIVLIGAERPVKALFEAPGERFSDTRLLDMANAPDPQPRQPRRPGATPKRDGRPAAAAGAQQPAPTFMQQRAQLFLDEGVAAVIEPSFRGDGGTLFVMSASVPSAPNQRTQPWSKDAPKTYPQIVCSSEHFNRLVRMIKQGQPLRMTVEMSVEFHDHDLMSYNTAAEIPGGDLKHELVMLGGHMDSWHSGTGATDNGAGVAVCLEAMRILKALDLKPRRTVRVALWSGEEQGLYGSRNYVKEHFGEFEPDPDRPSGDGGMFFGGGSGRPVLAKPGYDKLSVYFNLDNGTGKVRGVYMEGNEAVRSIFRRWLQPFRDLGASTLSPSPTGGTDHMSFDMIGLPGFQFIQDPIEYEPRTHHSNQDLYDRVQADDMKQASVIMASFVYQAAMMDERFPRKPMTVPIKPAESVGEKADTEAAGSGSR